MGTSQHEIFRIRETGNFSDRIPVHRRPLGSARVPRPSSRAVSSPTTASPPLHPGSVHAQGAADCPPFSTLRSCLHYRTSWVPGVAGAAEAVLEA